MAAPPRSYTEGSRAAGPGSEECGSEEQLGPGEIGQFFPHGCANRLPGTAHDPLIYGGESPQNCGSGPHQPSRRVVGNLEIQHDPASASGEGRGAVGDDFRAPGHLRQGVCGEDRVDLGWEVEVGRVGLHEADIAPAVRLYPILSLGEHRVGQIDADDPAVGTDRLLNQREVQTCAACDVDHAVTRAKAKGLYGPEALCPLGVAGRGVEPGGDVVVLRLLAVCLDQVLPRTVDLAHDVLLDLGRVAIEPRVTHLGLRASPRSGLDRSLDRRHLVIAYALNSAFEGAAGDRAHDAREVDLNPHLGVGLPIVHRLEFHSPARCGSTHWPGERHVAGRLGSGHLLAPAASPPEYPLRPLLYPRAGLKRSSSANPAFENRWRPLRPASDVTDIRPHLTDAAEDCYAALGSDCHGGLLLLTFRLRKSLPRRYILTETPVKEAHASREKGVAGLGVAR